MYSHCLQNPKPARILSIQFPKPSGTLQLTPLQFLTRGKTVLRTAIMQRRAINRKNPHRMSGPQTTAVFNMFDLYENKWNPAGLAGFIINHQGEIRKIIPASNAALLQDFENILAIAPNFHDQKQKK
ncbi:MAG: hypothetical protein K9H26_10865 [Prolixibacteraceae bacterium]|nr:hypothetical protein [Prolixibacteraceae bacterium]